MNTLNIFIIFTIYNAHHDMQTSSVIIFSHMCVLRLVRLKLQHLRL